MDHNKRDLVFDNNSMAAIAMDDRVTPAMVPWSRRIVRDLAYEDISDDELPEAAIDYTTKKPVYEDISDDEFGPVQVNEVSSTSSGMVNNPVNKDISDDEAFKAEIIHSRDDPVVTAILNNLMAQVSPDLLSRLLSKPMFRQ